MKTILTYGTFDIFHIGHVRILERARSFGDRLCVGISSDEFNTIKGKRSVIPFEHRAEIVKSMACVDEVFREDHWEQKEGDIRRLNVSVLVMGDDWKGKFDNFNNLCDVVYLSRTEGISTTELKSALSAFRGDKIAELKRGIEAMQAIVSQLDT